MAVPKKKRSKRNNKIRRFNLIKNLKILKKTTQNLKLFKLNKVIIL